MNIKHHKRNLLILKAHVFYYLGNKMICWNCFLLLILGMFYVTEKFMTSNWIGNCPLSLYLHQLLRRGEWTYCNNEVPVCPETAVVIRTRLKRNFSVLWQSLIKSQLGIEFYFKYIQRIFWIWRGNLTRKKQNIWTKSFFFGKALYLN